MEKAKSILYGVADYAQIRKKNAWFVDRTVKIRDLEQTAYAVFLRPRGFGKSMLTSILQAYYDVYYADRFDDPHQRVGPDMVKREANGGFYDLSMSPRFDIAPKITHAALIEPKYVKAGYPAPTKAFVK